MRVDMRIGAMQVGMRRSASAACCGRCDANGDHWTTAAPTSRVWQYRGVAHPASCGCMHSSGAMRLERSRTDSYELDGVVT